MAYDLTYFKHTITITFIAAAGMNGKVLEEIATLKRSVEGNGVQGVGSCLDHASDIRFTVDHEELR